MTVFEKFKSMSIDDFAKWYEDKLYEEDPCIDWWDNTYCKKCMADDSYESDGLSYEWCNIHGKCKYFQELDNVPDFKQMIKIWLESEIDE